MSDFSPTGYWAVFRQSWTDAQGNDRSTYKWLPVVDFGADGVARVPSRNGLLLDITAKPIWDQYGTFARIEPYSGA